MLTSLLLISAALPARADDKAKDEGTLRNAATVLQAMLDNKSVPANLLEKADCVIVLPSVKKGAFIVGGSGGRGPMIRRTGKKFSGKWSAPAMYTIGGASFGMQVGGSSTDFVLPIMAERAVDSVLQGKTKIGSDMTAAAGPRGATSAGSVGGADILTFGRAKGLFAGSPLAAHLSNRTVTPNSDCTGKRFLRGILSKAAR